MTNIILRTSTLAVLASVAVSAFAQQTFTFGSTNSWGAPGDSNNVTQLAFNPVGTAYLMGASATKISGTLESVASGNWPEDSVVRLSNSAFPGSSVVLRPIPSIGSFTTLPVVPGPAFYFASVGTLVGGLVPIGSTWDVEFYETFDDSTSFNDAIWQSLSFATQAVAPLVIPTSIDLGCLTSSPTFTDMPQIDAGQIKWFKIKLPAVGASATDYLDISTAPQVADLNTNYDTEIGLYDASGVRIATADDAGAGLYSLITFGDTVNFRLAHTYGTLSPGFPPDGFDGLLAGGTYYLAVSRFNVTFNPIEFSVTTDSLVSIPAGVRLLMDSIVFVPSQAITGTVTF